MAAAFNYHDGTTTYIDGEGMTWVIGTPYSPKTQAINHAQRDRDRAARWEAERVEEEAKKAKKQTEKAKKEAEKAKKETDQTNKVNQTPNLPVNCCVLL